MVGGILHTLPALFPAAMQGRHSRTHFTNEGNGALREERITREL